MTQVLFWNFVLSSFYLFCEEFVAVVPTPTVVWRSFLQTSSRNMDGFDGPDWQAGRPYRTGTTARDGNMLQSTHIIPVSKQALKHISTHRTRPCLRYINGAIPFNNNSASIPPTCSERRLHLPIPLTPCHCRRCRALTTKGDLRTACAALLWNGNTRLERATAYMCRPQLTFNTTNSFTPHPGWETKAKGRTICKNTCAKRRGKNNMYPDHP